MAKSLLLGCGLFALGVALSSSAAFAQSPAAAEPSGAPNAALAGDAQDGGIQDIVVTAQRRSESLQRVPIAVSVATSTTLANAAITNIADIKTVVPGLSANNGNGGLILHIRGVGTLANGPAVENPVSLYVDGVYYGTQTVGLIAFNNIDRVEVLKGPQGTLFGRNATGGLVSVVTRDPGQTFKANGALSYGNYDAVDASLYVGGPVATDLAADVGGHFARHDGYGRNLFSGKPVDSLKHDVAVRSKIVWSPSDFKFTLIGDYNDRRDTSTAQRIVEGSNALALGPQRYPKPWDTNSDTDAFLHIEGYGVSLKAEATLGSISVSNLAAFRRTDFEDLFDYDVTPLPITSVLLNQRQKQFSNEFQLASGADSAFTWVAGVYYFHATGDARPDIVTFAPTSLLNPAFPVTQVIVNGRQTTDSISGYGQATLKLSDQFSVTGGVRYSSEKRELNGGQDGLLLVPGNPIVPLVPTVRADKRFSRPTFRGALEYRPVDRVLLYASINTGFKSGGFNVEAPADPFYRPEKVTAYEVGQKADLFDRRVRINTAAFYYDYKNIQVFKPLSAGTSIINGANAEIYGLDLDITARPIPELDLTAGLNLLHAEFKDFPAAPIGSPGGGVPVGVGSAAGNRLGFAPKAVFNLGATYTAQVGANELVVSGTYLHSSSFFFEPDNVIRQGAYDLFNATIRYQLDGGRYSIGLYGRNLSNEAVKSVGVTIPAGNQLNSLQPPRTYGVTLGFNF